jgi:31-O-methyltransferase
VAETGSIDVRKVLRHPDPSQLLYQIQEIVEEQVYLQHGVRIADGDVVLDVGANAGVAAAFFAAECGAVVHSFEPVTPIYEILCENIRLFPSCVAHNFGLSSTAGRAEITYYPNADAMSGLYADPKVDRAFTRECMRNLGMSTEEVERNLEGRYDDPVVLECELRTLSSVLDSYAIERVALLKIDVERSELDVLEGIEERDWPKILQIVAEVHDEGDRVAAVTALLEKRGFVLTTEQEPAMRGTDLHLMYARRR